MSILTVTLPKYRSATATAANPETPKELARTTKPKTVAVSQTADHSLMYEVYVSLQQSPIR